VRPAQIDLGGLLLQRLQLVLVYPIIHVLIFIFSALAVVVAVLIVLTTFFIILLIGRALILKGLIILVVLIVVVLLRLGAATGGLTFLAGLLGVLLISGFFVGEVDLLVGLEVHVAHLHSLGLKVVRKVLVLLLVNAAKGNRLGV